MQPSNSNKNAAKKVLA